nr:LUD domain-containing protein [Roseospira visakhapatnamensis]
MRRGPLPPETAAVLDTRLSRPEPNVVPAIALGDRRTLVARFLAAAEAAAATTQRVPPGEEGAAVADFLRAHALPAAVAVAADPRLDGLAAAPMLCVTRRGADHGAPTDADRVGVSHALAGLAETGTLLLASGPECPATLNMLPDVHVVVVRALDVVGGLEDGWDRLRRHAGAAPLPRTVHLVTGPSRTGDIEQTLQLGAHGPRRLHIVLIDDDPAAIRA